MGIDRLLCLTLNRNDPLKQFLGKNFTQFNRFKKNIYPLSYYLSLKNINMAILLNSIHLLLH